MQPPGALIGNELNKPCIKIGYETRIRRSDYLPLKRCCSQRAASYQHRPNAHECRTTIYANHPELLSPTKSTRCDII